MTAESGAAEHSVFIGLGSNLQDPIAQVTRAQDELAALPETELLRTSSLYRSDPVGPPGQPDYINAVAHLRTRLEPIPLLDALQQIEQAHRRIRGQHWGPRTLDLDILLIDQSRLDLPRLTVPHPYAGKRSFVLMPLHEIAPDLLLPGMGIVCDLLAALPDAGACERISQNH